MLLDNKTLSLLAFCHLRLKETQKDIDNISSIRVLDTIEDEKFIKTMGNEIVKFCEVTRATKEGIEDRLVFHPSLGRYYNFIVDYYRSKINDGEYHIPFLFVLAVVRELKELKLINLDLPYNKAFALFEEAKEFNKNTKQSKIYQGKLIKDRSEIFKYEIMARDVLKGIWNITIKRDNKKKRKNRKKS